MLVTRRKLILIGVVVLLAVGLATSCADPPVARLTRTRMAVSNLRDVSHAEVWAPEHLAAAEEAMQAAERELALQRSRFGVMREYDKLIELLELTDADVEAARVAADAGRSAAEREAREALEAAASAIDHAWAALLIAPVTRGRHASSERLDEELSQAERSLEEVRNLIVTQDYRKAAARAGEILDEVAGLVRRAGAGRS